MVRENFFCEHTPQDVVDDCFARLQNESYQALNVDMVTKPVHASTLHGSAQSRFDVAGCGR
jgi:hypothetical protein